MFNTDTDADIPRPAGPRASRHPGTVAPMDRRLRSLLAGVVLLLAGCTGAIDDDPLPGPARRSPPPLLPSLGSPPGTAECFAPGRPAGFPGLIPLPATAELQGPDAYAGPYAPVRTIPRRIEGRGFAYEVSSRVEIVAGFYAICLETYVTELDWRQIHAEGQDVIFRIPLQSRADPVVVLIADGPDGGPTVVVTFIEHEIVPVPTPTQPSPTAPTPGVSP